MSASLRIAAAGTALFAGVSLSAPAWSADMVDGPTVTWNYSQWGKPRAGTKAGDVVARLLKERTGGKFTINVAYGEALSKARENLDGLKIGAFQMASFCNFYHPGKNPGLMVLTMPFLPIGDAQVRLKVTTALYEHPVIRDELKQWNAFPYVSSLLPQYEFLGRGEPPLQLADWKGKRVRAGGGLGDAMEVLGATKTTVPATEVYTIMERGAVDAVSFPFTYAHLSYRIHEVADWYTSNMSPGTSDCPVGVSITAWDALPQQYRDLMMEIRDQVHTE